MAGNAGNAGNAGGVGAVNRAAFAVLADRVDLPFVTEISGGTKISGEQLTLAAYPARNWSAEWRAWVALTQYANSAPLGSITITPWTDPTAATAAMPSEIDQLILAARDERADALGEIIGQNEEFASYFMALLSMSPGTYTATNRVINIASIISLFSVMYFKAGNTGPGGTAIGYPPRPRPSMVCPALLPPVPIPNHASYPSGHATEAHLIAHCLEDVLKARTATTETDADGAGKRIVDLYALAYRVARNREIAGLHYPSDRVAGAALATAVFAKLKDLSEYKTWRDLAHLEWVAPGNNP